jgi:hypothetical protein
MAIKEETMMAIKEETTMADGENKHSGCELLKLTRRTTGIGPRLPTSTTTHSQELEGETARGGQTIDGARCENGGWKTHHNARKNAGGGDTQRRGHGAWQNRAKANHVARQRREAFTQGKSH